MRIDDLVITTGGKAFRVVGLYLGGASEQSMVGLRPLIGNGQEMKVPVELVVTADIYRKVA